MSNLKALYERISDDQAGSALGVDRQDIDGKALASARSWDVKVYRDNDFSAYKTDVVRPDFERMLCDLEAGVVTGIVAADLDRLWRQPMDLERVIRIYENHPDYTFATTSVDIDLSTSDGRMLARVMVAAANKSSADTARRVANWHRHRIEKGMPGGGVRPFGFAENKIDHDPIEAAAIRHIAANLTAGASFGGQVRWLMAQGITTTRGNQFTPATLRQTLRNPRLCGMRAKWVKANKAKATPGHWEQVVKDGEPVIAMWQPILSVDEFDALQEALNRGVSPVKGKSREEARRYLLAGIARCGACGAAMRGVPSRYEGKFNYSCQPKTQGGCGGVARQGKPIDEIVEAAVQGALEAEMQGSTVAPEPWGKEAELERLETLKAEQFSAWKAGLIPSADYFKERSDLDATIKALKDEQNAHSRLTAEYSEAVDVVKRWEKASLADKRIAVRAAFAAIVIEPLPVVNGRKVRKWNPDLVRLIEH